MTLKQIIQHVFTWRILLIVVAVIGIQLLPFKDSFPYRETELEPYGHPLVYSWGNFDGVHYLGIAERGYWAEFTQAFFPLYPLILKWLNKVGIPPLYGGLVISHVSLILALYYLYEIVKMDISKQIARRTIWLLLAFPTAFYFGAVYTESLFLLLVVSSFYAMRKGHQNEAIILAAFASATRIVGIFLLPALLYEKYMQLNIKKFKLKHVWAFVPFGFVTSGLLAYMYWLQRNYGDALYFLNAQPAFGADRSSDKLILLYQVVFRYGKMFFTTDVTSLLFYTISQEFWISIIFLGLLAWAWFKIRKSYLIYAIPAYLLPTLTGTFSSMPRYVLVLFPAFIILAQIIPQKFFKLFIVFSAILLAINTLLFTRGYWIA